MTGVEFELFFDPISYGRAPNERWRPLSMSHIKLITRTVGRTPEVMVKVVNKGSSSLAGVGRHVGYIGRQGGWSLKPIRVKSCKAKRPGTLYWRIGILI